MFWRRKRVGSPLGVPLGDLADLLEAAKFKLKHEENAIVAMNGRLATRIEALPPAARGNKGSEIKAVVRVTTDVPRAIRDAVLGDGLISVSMVNAMSTLGAVSVRDDRMFIGSRLTIFEAEDAWERLHLPLLLFTVMVAADGPLGAVKRVLSGSRSPDVRSDWDEADFSSIRQVLSRAVPCTSDCRSFSGRIPLDSNAGGSRHLAAPEAIMQLRADSPHPEMGGGLFILLQMPGRCPTEEETESTCAKLNLLEMNAADLPPHFGAWCPGGDKTSLAYVSFYPNPMHAIPGIGINVAMWALHRARWAAAQLQPQ
jgi:hypothetical protein